MYCKSNVMKLHCVRVYCLENVVKHIILYHALIEPPTTTTIAIDLIILMHLINCRNATIVYFYRHQCIYFNLCTDHAHRCE